MMSAPEKRPLCPEMAQFAISLLRKGGLPPHRKHCFACRRAGLLLTAAGAKLSPASNRGLWSVPGTGLAGPRLMESIMTKANTIESLAEAAGNEVGPLKTKRVAKFNAAAGVKGKARKAGRKDNSLPNETKAETVIRKLLSKRRDDFGTLGSDWMAIPLGQGFSVGPCEEEAWPLGHGRGGQGRQPAISDRRSGQGGLIDESPQHWDRAGGRRPRRPLS